MYRTDLATEDELKHWNEIISRCPNSEALHTMEWKNALSISFKQLKPQYFVTRDNDNNIVGALPCFVFHPIPFSKTMLSMPWALPGGPLIFPGADTGEAVFSMIRTLDKISQKQRSFATTITLPPGCDPDIIESIASTGYDRESEQFTHVLRTDRDYEEIWSAYNRNHRRSIGKSEKKGIMVRETGEEAEMIEFYKLYLAAMKRFGSTPKPYQLLRYLQTSSIAHFVIAELGDRLIGGLLSLHFNSSMRLWCIASDPDFLGYCSDNAMINYSIQWACESGYSYVDFGASPPERSGVVAFKEDWGTEKMWFYTFTKLHSSWRRRLWTVSEPALRRVYSAIQRFRIRGV